MFAQETLQLKPTQPTVVSPSIDWRSLCSPASFDVPPVSFSLGLWDVAHTQYDNYPILGLDPTSSSSSFVSPEGKRGNPWERKTRPQPGHWPTTHGAPPASDKPLVMDFALDLIGGKRLCLDTVDGLGRSGSRTCQNHTCTCQQ